jgi:acetolactate synthase-1/2/3 large subunit
VLLGLGASPAVAENLRRWLNAWNLPVAVTPKVKGIVDETSENFVGVVGGMALDQVMVDAIQFADLIVGVGFDPVEVDKTWHAELPITWVLESPQATNLVPKERVLAVELASLLERLSTSAPPRRWDDAFVETRRRREIAFRHNSPDEENGVVSPIGIVRALAEVFPAETIVTTDVGSHKFLFGQFWPSREPNTFFMSNGLSGMGYGLPAAIGAKLAMPHAPVLSVLGDGGFSMNSQELETARRIGATIITVVLADGSYSLIRHGQVARRLPNYGVDFCPIDAVRTAQACGIDAERVTSADELATVVRSALQGDLSLLVEVPVDPDAWQGLV